MTIVVVVRIARPSWMDPVDTVGEWVGLLGGIAVVLGLVGVLISGILGGADLTCIGDPTDPCQWSVYRVRNDTGSAMTLRQCVHHCGRGDQHGDWIELKAGGLSSAEGSNTDVTAFVGAREWWELRSATGRALGCLVLDGHEHKHDGDLVLASAARPCSDHQPTTPAQAEG